MLLHMIVNIKFETYFIFDVLEYITSHLKLKTYTVID